MKDTLQKKIADLIQLLQSFADRFWYPPFIGFLAALDNLIVIIPNDGILISSSMLTPRRWLILAFSVAIGSTLGALALSLIVDTYGLSMIQNFYPHFNQTESWLMAANFFERYGLLLVFVVALTPLAQQPAVILASLAKTPLIELVAVIFVGRTLKYLAMAYIGSHAPRLLKKIWGLKSELHEVGIEVEKVP